LLFGALRDAIERRFENGAQENTWLSTTSITKKSSQSKKRRNPT
jgi:hypothetical protein